MMPKLDGMSATRNIRQYNTWTPIISMTANTTDKDIQQYFLSGMNDVLPKPFNQGSLGTLLERYCAHLVVQRQHQQQLQLLQQNYSLNNTLLNLNNMTPQLTLIEENNEDSGKVNSSITNVTNNTSYNDTLSANNESLFNVSSSTIPQNTPLLTEQQQQQQQQWYLYANQKKSKLEQANNPNLQ